MESLITIEQNQDNTSLWSRVKTKSKGDDDFFTGDDVIDAYFNGSQDQLNNNKKATLRGFMSMLQGAMKEGASFVDYLDSHGVKYEEALLKVKSINRFNVMFLIDEDTWISDEFNSIYEKSIEIEKENIDRDYQLSLIFMPISQKRYNKDMLSSDGYNLSYERSKIQ